MSTFTPYEHGKTDVRTYRITKATGKHWRHELVDGAPALVCYGRGGRDRIRLTPDDAKALNNLGLVEVSSAAPAVTTEPAFTLPADWRTLPPGNVRALAKKLTGKPVANLAKAVAILEDHERAAESLKELTDGAGAPDQG